MLSLANCQAQSTGLYTYTQDWFSALAELGCLLLYFNGDVTRTDNLLM